MAVIVQLKPPFVSPINCFQNPRLHGRKSQFLIPERPLSSSSTSSSCYRFRISSRNGGKMPPLPETDCPVPGDQQPMKEYQNLSSSFPFSWASGGIVDYCSRLLVTWASFTVLVGLPVAWYGESDGVLLRVIGAVSSGILFVTIGVVRMYLGWAYVGNRLLSATVEYEETGWYDGQIWVKTAQVLARDRLLGSFQVKPVLRRLKYTLVTLGASLLICALLFINLDNSNSTTPDTESSGGRAVPGVYNDDSARSFEPDAFCGQPTI